MRAATTAGCVAAALVIASRGVAQESAAVETSPAVSSEFVSATAEQLSRQEEGRLRRMIADGIELRGKARTLAGQGQYAEAVVMLQQAIDGLGAPNLLTQDLAVELNADKATTLLAKAGSEGEASDFEAAAASLEAYRTAFGADVQYEKAVRNLETQRRRPNLLSPEVASPGYPQTVLTIQQLLLRGRSQYVAGDLDGAESSFRKAEIMDPENAEAKGFLYRIAVDKQTTGRINREKTRAQMLGEVARGWQRPGILVEGPSDRPGGMIEDSPLQQKLKRITIPSVNFSAVELGRVINTLSAISEEYDTTGIGTTKGVNIVVLDPDRKNPTVNISLRQLPLSRILDLIVQSAGFQYEVQQDVVVVKPGGESSQGLGVDTAFFPISRSAVTRMTGAGGTTAPTPTPAGPVDPFAPAAPTFAPAAASGGEAGAIRSFLQSAGVTFDTVPGSALAYDGAQLIVTQTPRNLDRIRNILNRYTDVKQVEIQARFLEVQEGALDELGFNWNAANTRAGNPVINPSTGFPVLDSSGRPVYDGTQTFNGSLRSLAQSVSGGGTASDGQIIIPGIDPIDFSGGLPTIPGIANLGNAAGSFANIITSIGDFDVSAVVRLLSQKSGTDLLSEPKVTVLSGNPATITVAQELRYPDQYGDAQSNVSGGGEDSSSGGVTITPATPQQFLTRNVGVELTVTPTVEEDDYSISLDLNPRVTEFEGFVEYGGQSIAIQNGTVVRTPSGIFQPIFSVRNVTTRVTVWDGATVILGGLTREEVRRVNDKVPWVGDLPLVGRFFRSEGETSQKRNLLIFVTANLVSPGGSPKRQALRGVEPSSLFQNPTIVTPSGSASRRTNAN